MRNLLIVSGFISLLVSCDPGNDRKTAATSGDNSIACAPLQQKAAIIAYANWQSKKLRLQLVGKQVDVGKSDAEFEIIDAQLLLTKQDGSCVYSHVNIGELTRQLPKKSDKTTINKTKPLDLPIESLGVIEGNLNSIVAFEQMQLSEDAFLLVVYHRREVKWGLTEFYATLVTIDEQQMVVGDRVLIGRDAMQPPVYYGKFTTIKTDGITQLFLTRNGDGNFVSKVAYSRDSLGAYREVVRSKNQEDLPQINSNSKRNSKDNVLKECGPEGVQFTLSKHTCKNNTKPIVERKGSIGRAADGHFIDEYSVRCQGKPLSTKLYYVDAYHCHRQIAD